VQKRTTSVLITGFGRFPGAPCNPTELLVSRLARMRRPALSGVRSALHVFPTSYAAVDTQLPALVAEHRPAAIVMFGLAGRTKGIRVEMLARNRTAQVFADIDGVVPKRGAIKLRAGALRGRAPFARLVAAARATGLPARLSRDAGAYLCNYGYWRALETALQPAGPAIVVFVHVPGLRTGARRNGHSISPTLAQLTRAAQAIVVAAAAAAKSAAAARPAAA
jgi:pyroglutamyl-peptidase